MLKTYNANGESVSFGVQRQAENPAWEETCYKQLQLLLRDVDQRWHFFLVGGLCRNTYA